MRSAQRHSRVYRVVVFAILMVGSLMASAKAELMPPAQQNALVQKYCAVCHTDKAKNGGLSLEHFDAAHAAPSLMAMLLSKLTSGVLLQTVRDASSDAGAAAFIEQKSRSGAMGAAGLPIPDKGTINSLIQAFAVESAGAMDWKVERSKNAAEGGPMLTASILRELPSFKNSGEAETYRFVASCNSATHEGYMQLAWSPVPRSGNLVATVDGIVGVGYPVAGINKMGSGTAEYAGLAALMLAQTSDGVPRTSIPFPNESLTITGLFPGEIVVFQFTQLARDTRKELNACFPGADSSDSLTSSDSR